MGISNLGDIHKAYTIFYFFLQSDDKSVSKGPWLL